MEDCTSTIFPHSVRNFSANCPLASAELPKCHAIDVTRSKTSRNTCRHEPRLPPGPPVQGRSPSWNRFMNAQARPLPADLHRSPLQPPSTTPSMDRQVEVSQMPCLTALWGHDLERLCVSYGQGFACFLGKTSCKTGTRPSRPASAVQQSGTTPHEQLLSSWFEARETQLRPLSWHPL